MADLSIADFRASFPEFTSTTDFPDAQVTLWLGFATQMVNQCRWGGLYNLGVYLVLAHNLILSARDQATADAGGTPGEVNGPVASKTIDKLSVSYDSGAAATPGDGDWSLTSYGVRYRTMSMRMGAGVIQL